MLWQVAILFGGWTVFGPDTNELGGLDATGRGLASAQSVSLSLVSGKFQSSFVMS